MAFSDNYKIFERSHSSGFPTASNTACMSDQKKFCAASTQWAAVSTWRGETREPPQKSCEISIHLVKRRATCRGYRVTTTLVTTAADLPGVLVLLGLHPAHHSALSPGLAAVTLGWCRCRCRCWGLASRAQGWHHREQHHQHCQLLGWRNIDNSIQPSDVLYL